MDKRFDVDGVRDEGNAGVIESSAISAVLEYYTANDGERVIDT